MIQVLRYKASKEAAEPRSASQPRVFTLGLRVRHRSEGRSHSIRMDAFGSDLLTRQSGGAATIIAAQGFNPGNWVTGQNQKGGALAIPVLLR